MMKPNCLLSTISMSVCLAQQYSDFFFAFT